MINSNQIQQNEEELSGVIENLVFHNETNGFSVIEINVQGELITCVGVMADAAPGEDVILTGRWDSHTVFGRQFRFSSCIRSLPDTTSKLYRYLASGAVKGIGPKTALKIIERFGDDTMEVLESKPDMLAVIKGISKERALAISEAFNQQYAMRKVMIELESYGVSSVECANIYKYFGVQALNTVRENPYILCGTVPGFGFDRVEKLSADMMLSPAPDYRNQAGILYIIKHNMFKHGHTCIPKDKIMEPSMHLLGISEEEAEQTVEQLIRLKKLVLCHTEDRQFLFIPETYRAEYNIAEHLQTMLRFPCASIRTADDDIARVEEENGIRYEDKQKQAIKTALEKGLLILTGGPGTGKTTALRGIIRVFERSRIDVLLCAPTGMAANRLSEVTGREAKTVHRLLEVEWDENEKPVFRKNTENPLSCGALIVDEMSMIDVDLFSSLLDALPLGCRLILVGDADQLPSVGPGNVLSDLIQSGKLPLVALTEVFRQAKKSLIVTNAHRIIEGSYPVLDRKDGDFFFLKRESSLDTAKTVTELIADRLPAAYGLSPLEEIQVLCPSKKGDCGIENINLRLQAALNPPDQTKNEISTHGGRVFREGDRVMQIKNNYNIEWEREDHSESSVGIFNGDVGVIKKINFAAGSMQICFDGRLVDYPTDNLSELTLAFSITVHKSQGNEYPVVILPLIDTPPMLTYRNLLYTAVTRARKMLIIVGSEEKIAAMIANNKKNRRYSMLVHFLND